MQKAYQRRNWENEPSTATPINEDNLNAMDYALDVVDTRVVELSAYKETMEEKVAQASASASSAATSETNAATSESNAAESESNAATSETNAQNSASAAATSASNAATSANTAATNATNASNSARTATAKASEASTSATSAATSATNAANSASSASTSADSAANSASNASTSASNAATSASNASTSESNAASSANNASGSATSASNAATDAAASRDSASASATSAAQSSSDAEAWAIGTRNGVDVPATDPTYNNNSKYYAESMSDMWKIQGKLGAKNLLAYPYYQTTTTSNGVTFTDNEDGSITIDGTATSAALFYLEDDFTLKAGSYILSSAELFPSSVYSQVLNKSTGSSIASIGNNNIQATTFTVSEDTVVRVRISSSRGNTVNNLTVHPMLRYATDTDDTWQPYAPTNKTLDNNVNGIWAIQGKFGSKNLLKKPYNTPTPYVTGGITFSDNEDGGVVINGTSTGYIILQMIRELEVLPHGKYILSVQEDLPSGVVLQMGYVTTDETIAFIQKGYNALTTHSMVVTIDDEFDGNLINIRLSINSGTTVDNLVIHPMLRYAEDTDSTWQPYAMSNKQLTDAIMSNGEEIANESTVSQELKPNYFHLFTNAVKSLTITLPSNRRPWNEFNFAFTTSSSGCNLALPSAVTWVGGTPTLDANTYYEVSIRNNRAVIG